MKKIYLVFILLVVIVLSSKAQTTATDALNAAIAKSEANKTEISNCRRATNQLSKQLLLTGNPSTQNFTNVFVAAQDKIQVNLEDINGLVNEALTASNNAFPASRIFQTLTQSQAQITTVLGLQAQVVAAVNAGNKTLAQSLIPQLNTALSRETSLANQLINRLKQAIEVVRPYQVVVRTVNSQGVPVPPDDLFGFYCINTANNQVFYPSNQEGNAFTLPAGTYTFDAYPGYFSGVSSKTVTLIRSLEDANGVVTIDLVYWSE